MKIYSKYGKKRGSGEQVEKIEGWKRRNFPSTTTENGTIESGRMTKDLALITTLKDVTVLNSEDFIKEVRKTFESLQS